MHMTKVFAFATILAAGALAAPAAEANPPKPTPPQNPPQPTQTTVNQSNACGNNATPYCCNTDNKGKYTTCYAFQFSSQCSATTVCCNNNGNNDIQVCLGNAQITHPF